MTEPLVDRIKARRAIYQRIADIARDAAIEWARSHIDEAKTMVQNYVDTQVSAAKTQARQYVDGRIAALLAANPTLTPPP